MVDLERNVQQTASDEDLELGDNIWETWQCYQVGYRFSGFCVLAKEIPAPRSYRQGFCTGKGSLGWCPEWVGAASLLELLCPNRVVLFVVLSGESCLELGWFLFSYCYFYPLGGVGFSKLSLYFLQSGAQKNQCSALCEVTRVSITNSSAAGRDSSFWDQLQNLSAGQRFLEESVTLRVYSQPLTLMGRIQGREYKCASI